MIHNRILEVPGAFEERMELRRRMAVLTGATEDPGPLMEADMVAACMDCTSGSTCAAWLDAQGEKAEDWLAALAQGPVEPPAFCANRLRLAEMAGPNRRDGA